MSDSPVRVEHLADDNRFAAHVGGETAVLLYQPVGDGVLDLQHTLVPRDAQGRGVAGALVRAAVDYARQADVKLIPSCEYVAAWLARHPREADVFVDDGDY